MQGIGHPLIIVLLHDLSDAGLRSDKILELVLGHFEYIALFGRCHGCRPRLAGEERDLAEKIAWLEYRQFLLLPSMVVVTRTVPRVTT